MFTYLDEVVEEICEENVVQVIIDNASNYVNAGMRLMEKRGRFFATCPGLGPYPKQLPKQKGRPSW